VREVVRFVWSWLLRPSSVGALYLLGLAALAARAASQADQALGGQTRAIHDVVERHFAGEIDRITLAIVAVTVILGAGLGALAGLLVALRDRLARAPVRAPLVRAAYVLGVVAVLHALVEGYAIADAPQLYANSFYAKGGSLRLVQVLLTDDLGRGGVLALAAVLAAVFLAGPVSQWRRWPGRLSRGLLPRGVGSLRKLASGAAVLAVVLGALWALPASPRVAHAEAPAGRPNVLILAADSLRADRLVPRIAPHLSRLAEQGTRFDRAYVSLPRTFPSWVTLLTGRHPHHHGIRSMFPRWEERTKDFDALPERLAAAGYTTEVVSDFAGDIFDRIDLGWTKTHVPSFDFRQLVRQRALERETPLLPFLHSRVGRSIFPILREMNDAADPDMLASDVIDALGEAKKGPFFLTVFFSTAHFPYAAPAPYYRRFTDRSYRGRFKYDRPVGLEREEPPDEADVAQVRGLYDGAVASIDAASARILGALDRLGLAKNTIVVVVADHGETLWENGRGEGHGDHLFGDEGTHVPLVVFDPQRPGGRHVDAIVRDVDLAPTLYDLLGVDAAPHLDGQSLAPWMSGGTTPKALAYAETGLWFTEDIAGLDPALRIPYSPVSEMTEVDADHHDDVVLKKEMRDLVLVAKHRMVRDDRYKLVFVPSRSGVRYMLFDTQEDPGETRDIAAENKAEVQRLSGELWKWMLSDPNMDRRRGYLLPRVAGVADAPDEGSEGGHVIRLDAAPQGAAAQAAGAREQGDRR
jgi:arylsulfatase A-like enzyme